MPRVVGGTAKRIKLDSVDGQNTRPTSDRVKESLFNIISEKVCGCSFLDLFSGTGQIGIEALSRGALCTVFIENSSRCVKTIQKNLNKTGLFKNAHIIFRDVISGIKTIDCKRSFDIVYVDPPYNTAITHFRDCVKSLTESGLLCKDAIIILEHSSRDMPEKVVMNLKLKRSCKYGSVMLSFYENIL